MPHLRLATFGGFCISTFCKRNAGIGFYVTVLAGSVCSFNHITVDNKTLFHKPVPVSVVSVTPSQPEEKI